MAVNSLSWFRAAQLLNIPETERGKGWHDGFSAYELALMQAPGDEEEQKVIQAAIQSSLSSTTARNPKNRDIGRVTGIDSHIVGAATAFPEQKSPQITLYAAQTVSDWLRNNNESPSPILASWFKAMCIDSITWSGDIQLLEPLTDEQKQDYNSRAAWTWVDAIYILQGYKPVFQLSTEQVRSHFPDWVKYFTDSLRLGTVGKETMEAGQRIFIDSPANWQAFWKGASKQSETGAKVGADNKDETKTKERELTQWLRETWIKENKPGGTDFFTALKRYEDKPGSPIVEHYGAGKGAGIRWQTSAGTTGTMAKKTVLTKVSAFKNTS